jgi:hypothetical protein
MRANRREERIMTDLPLPAVALAAVPGRRKATLEFGTASEVREGVEAWYEAGVRTPMLATAATMELKLPIVPPPMKATFLISSIGMDDSPWSEDREELLEGLHLVSRRRGGNRL